MKFAHIALTILLSAGVAFGVTHYAAPTSTTAPTKETAFERVMRTGTLKCAYVIGSPPRFIHKSESDKPEGILVDTMEAMGKKLNIKIQWDEQTTYGLFAENLRSGKQDAFCGIVWRNAARARKVILTAPLYYTSVHAYVKEADTRFNSLDDLNKEDVIFALLDGSSMVEIASAEFPKAQQHAAPLNASSTDTILDVVTGKADVVLYDQLTAADYNAHNPDKKLKKVPSDKPIRLYGESYAVNMGEWELREMLDTALGELQTNGTIDRILNKYNVDETIFPRAQDPYAPLKE